MDLHSIQGGPQRCECLSGAWVRFQAIWDTVPGKCLQDWYSMYMVFNLQNFTVAMPVLD